MPKKILAYNAYLQVFALFESASEAQTMKDQMSRCGHTLAIIEVEEFTSGSYAFEACQPKPVVVQPDRRASNSRESHYQSRAANHNEPSRRSFGSRESVSNYGRSGDESMFQQVIGSMTSSGSSDSGSSSGDSGGGGD